MSILRLLLLSSFLVAIDCLVPLGWVEMVFILAGCLSVDHKGLDDDQPARMDTPSSHVVAMVIPSGNGQWGAYPATWHLKSF